MTMRSTHRLCCTLKPAVFRFFSAAVVSLFVTFGVTAEAQECQLSVAPTVTFAQATSGAETPACVEMTGIIVGRLFVEDNAARYRPERVRGDPSSSGAVLGYFGEQRFDTPTRVRIVGQLSDCVAVRLAMRDDPLVTPADHGYCLGFEGRTIRAVYLEPLGPAPLARLRPGQGDPALGNLSPLPNGDVRQRMLAAADRYLTAVQSGDRATLAAMHGGGPTGRRDPRDLDRVLSVMLDQPTSPFAALRDVSQPTVEIFGWKPPLWADDQWRADAARSGTSDAIACFSARADGAAHWPIDSKDADNIPGRPYACTRIHIAGTGADSPASFDTDQARSGVAERAYFAN
jgi:hypothetical protein